MPLQFADGERVFKADGEGTAHAKAFEYIERLAVLDLQYRGFRDERISSFQWKQRAMDGWMDAQPKAVHCLAV